jgi:hypothetical protein
MRIAILPSALVLVLLACEPVKDPDAQVDANTDALSCTSYCTTIMDACGDTPQYANQRGCEDHCTSYAGLPLGNEGEQSGNTVACRLYHATVASATTPELHCPHAGPTGGNVCGSWCENYCFLALRNCPMLFGDGGEERCQQECGQIPDDGESGDQSGDTVQCRMHYLGLAGTEPPLSAMTFCPAGQPFDSPECQ